ncbi:MAG TPA: tetratricopeptide repeat protein [Pyrinomonadaceae bacterium]|jgi:tetratricopeptide (TPR) repeat protein|nr:tetratricopeptide repeat protein [Pyrinomonadaceae bacterium]
MTLADERLKELDNLPLAGDERVLLCCAVASDLVQKGQYEAAREALGELWPGVCVRPEVNKLPPVTAAEVLLQCGTLSGWLGSARNVSGAQEQAKDLLSEALRKFDSQGEASKVAEVQYELGMCYWRLGQYDEARVVLEEAFGALGQHESELKAKILIRRTLVEIWTCRYHEAWDILDRAAAFFDSCGDALKGRWHGQRGLVLRRLATAEGRSDYADRAIMEFTAAIYHYEQAGHERYCATNLNNLAMLLYKLGRYAEAHEHLNRAQLIFTKLKDPGNLAQVDETRARALVAEKKYHEASRVIDNVIRTFERAGESALLADALTIQGVVWARLGSFDNSINTLRQAMKVAEDCGALTQAGLAALTLIEEHGATWRLTESELAKIFRRASGLLKGTQDAEDKERLSACSLIVVKRLSGMELRDKNFSFYGAVHELEARLIEQALESERGSVSRAAKRLGLKHQSLSHMLHSRHKKLMSKRTPPEKRLRSIIKVPKE